MIKYFFVLLLIAVGFQNDWLSERKQIVTETDNKAIVERTNKEDFDDAKMTTTVYKTPTTIKTTVATFYPKLQELEQNFYEQHGILIAVIQKGKAMLIYQGKRQAGQPYAKLIDYRSYFKNKTEGVALRREIDIHEGDDIDQLKQELSTQPFTTTPLTAKDYIALEEIYSRAIKE